MCFMWVHFRHTSMHSTGDGSLCFRGAIPSIRANTKTDIRKDVRFCVGIYYIELEPEALRSGFTRMEKANQFDKLY